MNENPPQGVILCGGYGKRFWPLSRKDSPKPLLDFDGRGSLLERTYNRLLPIFGKNNIWAVIGKDHADKIRRKLKNIPSSQVLVEPHSRNTLPAIMFAYAMIIKKYPETVMAVFPADHLILDEKKFQTVIKNSISYAINSSSITTLGIKPTRGETGYGYIKVDKKINPTKKFLPVKRFVEKPSREAAKKYFVSGNYLWNSGMFLASTGTWQAEFDKHVPAMLKKIKKVSQFYITGKNIGSLYSRFKPAPVDKAVMEKSTNIEVYPCEFRWSDVGTWLALKKLITDKKNPNAIISSKNIITEDTRGCVIVSGKTPVVTIGLRDTVIVNMDDVLLVMSEESHSKLNKIVTDLQKSSAWKKHT